MAWISISRTSTSRPCTCHTPLTLSTIPNNWTKMAKTTTSHKQQRTPPSSTLSSPTAPSLNLKSSNRKHHSSTSQHRRWWACLQIIKIKIFRGCRCRFRRGSSSSSRFKGMFRYKIISLSMGRIKCRIWQLRQPMRGRGKRIRIRRGLMGRMARMAVSLTIRTLWCRCSTSSKFKMT